MLSGCPNASRSRLTRNNNYSRGMKIHRKIRNPSPTPNSLEIPLIYHRKDLGEYRVVA